jgi:hypothetical protein
MHAFSLELSGKLGVRPGHQGRPCLLVLRDSRVKYRTCASRNLYTAAMTFNHLKEEGILLAARARR